MLAALPFEHRRSKRLGTALPDHKRYRDPRHVYESIGLLYEDGNGVVRLTALGEATRRWLHIINPANAPVFGEYAAYALATCQLRNPSYAGSRYAPEMTVFPFAFIWRAMLALDCKLSSEELNREIFRVRNVADLSTAIENIRRARVADDVSVMRPETLTDAKKNDRIIAWMARASFGWVLFRDKRSAGPDRGFYTIPDAMVGVLTKGSRIRRRHREFDSVERYVNHIAQQAGLPLDIR